MFKPRHSATLFFLAIIVASCAPTTRFAWGDYENSLYRYYKDPAELASYREALTEAIEDGNTTGRLAPGLYAELGYTYLQQGDMAVANGFFEAEMTNFPESRPFLSGLMQRLAPQTSEVGSPAS